MTESPEPSDQLPEEGPEEQVPDDAGPDPASEADAGRRAREEGDVRDTQEQRTGNPDAAG